MGNVKEHILSQIELSNARIAELQLEKKPFFDREKEIKDSIREARRLKVIKRGIIRYQGWGESDEEFKKRVIPKRLEKEKLYRRYRYWRAVNNKNIDAVTARQNNELEKQKKLMKRYEDFAKLINFVKYIEQDSFWRAEIVQIVASTMSSGDLRLELIPRSGNHTVSFGTVDDVEEKHAFLSAAKAKGYEVLEMNGQLDNHYVNWYESKHSDTRFVRVDSDVVEKLIQKAEPLKISLTEAQQELLRPVFESQMPRDEKIHYSISFEAMEPEEAPVVITQNEFMRRMKEMAQMGGGGMSQFYGQMPDSFTIAVNGNHPIVIDILGKVESAYGDKLKSITKKIDAAVSEEHRFEELTKEKKEEELTSEEKSMREELSKKVVTLRDERNERLKEIGRENKLVKQIIDLALLSNGMLKGKSLTDFIQRSISLIE